MTEDLMKYEYELLQKGISLIAGVDEAGRGPLAGPVVAAAVIMPLDAFIEGVNDSKKLSAKKREILYEMITERALAVGVGIVGEKEIDTINILNAAKKAMAEAVNGLAVKPEHVLVDAVKIPGIEVGQTPIIKGDALSYSIAAASIIAKVTRDRIMVEYSKKYPEYGFESHKGYGSKAHIEKLKEIGPCGIHRRTFIKNFVGEGK